MLFATFKYHQSDFQLKLIDKFMCAKLALKTQLKDSTVLLPVSTTIDLIALPASQRDYVFTFIIKLILFIYTYVLYLKIYYLLLNHSTFMIFCKKAH